MLAVAVRIRSVTTAAITAFGVQAYRKSPVLELRCWNGMCAIFVRVVCSFPCVHVSFGFLGLYHHERGEISRYTGFAVDKCIASVHFFNFSFKLETWLV